MAMKGTAGSAGPPAASDTVASPREEQLRHAYTQSLGGQRGERLPLQPPAGAAADELLAATVLFTGIRSFTSLAEKLEASEVAQLLTEFFKRVSQSVVDQGGSHLKFMGDGLMAVFADAGGGAAPAARRGVAAGLAVALATHAFRGWLQQRFPDRGLPPFAIGLGLHAGEVTLCRVGSGSFAETIAAGETVNSAVRLEEACKELGWTVAASSAVLQRAGAGVQTGGMTSLQLPGRPAWLDVAEILGLEAEGDPREQGPGAPAARAEEIRRAVEANSQITARAVKGALRNKLSTLKAHAFGPDDAPLRLKGFRLTRKLASGASTDVYLAVREEDGLPVVLKVLEASGPAAGADLARFIQEHALVSRIQDARVTRIYDQGFTDGQAYIAMEYFARGDLRAELRAGVTRERALAIAVQVAQALEVIHGAGIIHRDLKPGNVMLRDDGSIALADFGIAKSMHQEEQRTSAREGVGTPFYLSPEQAAGGEITPASDLYSLGVMLFEMLAGRRPYSAETLTLLLARHLSAPTPLLPQPHADLQPVIDKLMAKNPQDRYPTARALLDDLAQRHG